VADGKPIVLCALDWVGIGNAGHDAFREALAQAAGTHPDRVAVHCLHQHDAPACDFSTEALLVPHGLGGRMFDPKSARDTIQRLATAVRDSLQHRQPVTHLGLGVGRVRHVASNRRILGADGKVAIVRFSASRKPEAQQAPEGVIDPDVRLLSLWNGDTPLISITYYATHPQSYYGQGGVSADFVGLARRLREQAVPHVQHIHFNGAGGNVAAGKYNDGSPALRGVLAERLAAGMQAAWNTQQKSPLTTKDVAWQVRPVTLPVRNTLQRDALQARLQDAKLNAKTRIRAARDLAFLTRMQSGHRIPLACLSLGRARVLLMPGELFVEYQLAAQRLRPDLFVTMAAYGDYGPGYIGTQIAYAQGGYETGIVSRTAPNVERTLQNAIHEFLMDR
ncbi:MAG: hypothetical protein ABGZ17_10440, partial [Planctomycetaceae bacterium]